MDVERGRAQVAGGQIAWAVRGRGAPVLMIQGVGIAGCAWAPQAEGLADRFSCAHYDNRGLGDSEAPTDALSIELMAQDALAVMDSLGWSSAHVVGHSMGGLIAQALALLAPERVQSLALLCTFARGSQAARLDFETFWFGMRMNVGTRAMRRRAAVHFVLPDAYIATRDYGELCAELAMVFGRDLGDQPKVAVAQLRAMGRYDPSARISEVATIPALVLTADRDRVAKPEFTRELAASLGVEPIIVQGAGHACTVQLAGQINERLAAHWSSAAPAR